MKDLSDAQELYEAASHHALNVGTPSSINDVHGVITAKHNAFKAGAEWRAKKDAIEVKKWKDIADNLSSQYLDELTKVGQLELQVAELIKELESKD